MTMLPPNPADLATEHAAALAEDAGRVFQYLAELARAAAELAAERADDFFYAASESDESAMDLAAQAEEHADAAEVAARRADRAAELARSFGALGYAAEDIEPAAIAEVARALAEAVAVALAAVARGGQS